MNLRNRHFLKLLDFAPTELERLLQSALTLKRLRQCGQERPALGGKNVALLFEEKALGARQTVQAAISSQGAVAHYFGPGETGVGRGDEIHCGARQLGRLFDGIALRGAEQEKVEEVSRLAGVPICNLGSKEFAPLNALADLVTLLEHSSKPLCEVSLVILGDGTTALAQSMLVGAAKLGIDLRVCGPKDMQPEEALTETCLALSAETGAQLRLFTEPEQAVKGADFIYAQSWIDQKSGELDARVDALLPYRATGELVSQSGQGRVMLLHQLPVLAGEETELGALVFQKYQLEGLEVSRELFDSAFNLAFEQAENALHCCKAVFISLLV